MFKRFFTSKRFLLAVRVASVAALAVLAVAACRYALADLDRAVVHVLIGVVVGAWLMHRRQDFASPMPTPDLGAVLRYLKTGDPTPKAGEVPPPVDPTDHNPPHWKL